MAAPTASSGFLGLLSVARRELLAESDSLLAQRLARDMDADLEQQRREQMERDEALARAAMEANVSPAKVIMRVARGAPLGERTNASSRPHTPPSAECAAASTGLAESIAAAAREAAGINSPIAPPFRSGDALEDRAYLMAVAAAGAAEIRAEMERITQAWRDPNITAQNAADGGICVTMTLPSLDRSSLRVRADAATKEICVTAAPKLSHIYALLPYLPADMRSEALSITLDLKIVGKERVCSDDVAVQVGTDAASGGMDVVTVAVRNAFLRDKPSASPVKIHGVCS